jgi:hypothetical protein
MAIVECGLGPWRYCKFRRDSIACNVVAEPTQMNDPIRNYGSEVFSRTLQKIKPNVSSLFSAQVFLACFVNECLAFTYNT